MSAEKRAAELFLDFPVPPASPAGTLHTRQVGKLLFVGGALPIGEGRIQGKGRLGLEVSLDQGRGAARLALIQALAMIREEVGSLDKVRQVVQLTGQIASGAEFHQQGKVLDQASQLLVELFGAAGNHTRTAIGVTALPQQACVQIELIVEIK
ncbi:MAG: RidA family protein [Deltaproteobacteria bacterium]|nr:RidA family protein [Deltaproteobacteria bacterium]